jgi:actin-related protein
MSAIQEKLKKMEIFFDQEEFLVIDNGTGFIKAGFSGQDLPRLVIPTVVGSYKEAVDSTLINPNSQEDMEPKTHYTFGDKAL